MALVLIIDDEATQCNLLTKMVESMGHQAVSALTLQRGLQTAVAVAVDVVLLDVNMPDGSGLDLLPRLRSVSAKPEVIIITGQGDPDGAELSIRNGAWDYLEKPMTLAQVKLVVSRALQYRQGKPADPRDPRNAKPLHREGIIGSSPQIAACLELVAQAARSDVNVLLSGPTGTGKELFARSIHHNSARSGRSFVVVDCAALPDTLVESLLFGHEKGAFTGADRPRKGLILEADGGTLLLDEVGELPLNVQGAFLRVLQEHRFRPLGGTEERSSDFRLIAATNRDLDAMVVRGEFRGDLLFRLRTFAIVLPPLKARRGDILEIALHHLALIGRRCQMEPKGFSPEVIEILEKYPWPGNVRELVQAIERACSAAFDEPVLFPRHLPDYLRIQIARRQVASRSEAKGADPLSNLQALGFPPLSALREQAVSRVERQYLGELLSVTGGDLKKASEIAGLGRSRLYELIKRYKILPLAER